MLGQMRRIGAEVLGKQDEKLGFKLYVFSNISIKPRSYPYILKENGNKIVLGLFFIEYSIK